MLLLTALCSIAGLLLAACLAIVMSRSRVATPVVYALCLLVALVALANASAYLLASPTMPEITSLPLGLPWIGAHFRLDALAAFFLLIVNLGAAAASLFALGYGRHESAPHRVLPFYAAFLAGMNLVVLADDAFSFLFCWELMSLASWALVISHHRSRENIEAGFIYLVMAGFGTFCLLLAFGLLAGSGGNYTFDVI